MLKRIANISVREIRVNLNYHAVTGFGVRARHQTPIGASAPTLVAIVRLDLIGDFVLFTAALPYFRSAFPGARLLLLGNSAWGDLAQWLNAQRIVTESTSLFDEYVGVEPARLVNLRYFRSMAEKARTADVVINAAYSRTNVGDKLIAASGRESIGCVGDTTNILAAQKRLNDRLYTRLIPNSASETEWERNIDFTQALAPGSMISRTPPLWKLHRDLVDAELTPLSGSAGELFGQAFIAVSPFASLAIKQWPLERYRELMGRILHAWNALRVVMLGGPDKTLAAESLVHSLPDSSRVVNLIGRTSLVEATCLIRKAKLSISGDTAAGHLASAVGTPAVVVMGGGHYGRFFPYYAPHPGASNQAVVHRMDCFHCNWLCKYRRFSNQEPPCLAEITVDDVFARVAPLLST